MDLSARGVLTLVDNAVRARFRELYLRLRARDPATEVIADPRPLADFAVGATLILTPALDDADLLNFHRPLFADRRYNVVLWCEGDLAGELARAAPDFFDWISLRVDCPPSPAAHAVSTVRRAICARATGIAWSGPGLEETLAHVRPRRPLHRVAIDDYDSMLAAVAPGRPAWLFLTGVDDDFRMRRLRWAIAESGRRHVVVIPALGQPPPGWWRAHATHMEVGDAVAAITAAGGSGRLAALSGLDPETIALAVVALRHGVANEALEAALAVDDDPRRVLTTLVGQGGWAAVEPDGSIEAPRATGNDGGALLAILRRPTRSAEDWASLGERAAVLGDDDVAVRWLTKALELFGKDADARQLARTRAARGRAYRLRGELAPARVDLEVAHMLAWASGDASTIAVAATAMANLLFDSGQPRTARTCLHAALERARPVLGDHEDVATLLDMSARAELALGAGDEARAHVEEALEIKRRIYPPVHPSIAVSLAAVGGLLASRGELDRARPLLEQSLAINLAAYGDHHPSVISTLQGLAHLERERGELGAARIHLERAVALQRAVSSTDDHPEVARALSELGAVQADLGDFESARANLERSLAIQRGLGLAGELFSAETATRLADVTAALGHRATAQPDGGEPSDRSAAPRRARPADRRYDLFLAHSRASTPSARALYDLLRRDVAIFLSERSLLPGDDWTRAIPAAQRQSLVTAVLLSSSDDQAWYLSDEVVTAIALHREAPDAHRVVAVKLDPDAPVPYGLHAVLAIDVARDLGLEGVAARLRQLMARLRRGDGALPPVAAAGGSERRTDPRALYTRLVQLTDSIFERVLFLAGVDRSRLSMHSEPLARRALDVAQLAAFDEDLSRRLSHLLDEHAPWTR